MGRRKQIDPALFPVQGDEKQVDWLPRDVKLGCPSKPLRGHLLCGWDGQTDTCQLWRIIDLQPLRAEFVGYVVGSPPGGIRRKE